MKLFLAVALFLAPSLSYAVDLGLNGSVTSSGISVENTTVALSSSTALLVTPAGRYMELHLSAPTATYYYRIDGTTTSVTTAGFPVLNAVATVIKVLKGNVIALQSGVGASAETLRAVKITYK